MPPGGKTPVHLSYSTSYRNIIRTIHMLDQFDRIQVAAIHKVPFGTASRVFSELENERYIKSIRNNRYYIPSHLRRNEDLKDHRFNYSNSANGMIKSVICVKTERWDHFVKRWSRFLKDRV